MRPNTEFSVFTSHHVGSDAIPMTRAGSSSGGSGLAKRARVVVVGDTVVSEEGMAAIVGRDKRYRVCGGAHGFYAADELIRKHQPDLLLIEPFLEDRDGIRWVKDLATEFPQTRLLIVSRQSERVYAERALHAGAAGYWMKNGSADELMHAVETAAAGKIYVSPLIASLALEKFTHREILPQGCGQAERSGAGSIRPHCSRTKCGPDCEEAWYQPNHRGNTLSAHQSEAWLSQR